MAMCWPGFHSARKSSRNWSQLFPSIWGTGISPRHQADGALASAAFNSCTCAGLRSDTSDENAFVDSGTVPPTSGGTGGGGASAGGAFVGPGLGGTPPSTPNFSCTARSRSISTSRSTSERYGTFWTRCSSSVISSSILACLLEVGGCEHHRYEHLDGIVCAEVGEGLGDRLGFLAFPLARLLDPLGQPGQHGP